jgi:hypothetical protein
MLFGSLIFLAISLRYPFTPHEIGWDSFYIHKLVNLLNHQGNYVSWWVHPLSPFGLTPFSYTSAVPVLVSAFSQASGLSIESSAWLFGIFCGLLGIFGSFLVAKELFNDDCYIFLVVFGFTTSQVFLGYTTWTLTTRGFFITILPFFLFLLFKNSKSRKFNIYSILTILIFIFLVAIHHLYSFLIFPLFSYYIIKNLYLFKKSKINNNFVFEKKSRLIINIVSGITIFFIIILVILSILFSTPLTKYIGEKDESVFELFFDTIITYARQLGILGLFGIIGFFYLLYKYKKTLNDVLLIFFILYLLPFILIIIYMPIFIAIFIYLLAGFGLYHIVVSIYNKKYEKMALSIIILILTISLIFSYIYRIRYPDIEAETEYDEIYMEENNYDVGLWLKYSINDSVYFSNNIYPSMRIAGIMNSKQFPGSPVERLEYGYVSLEDYNVTLLSPLDPNFWSESFYETEPHQETLFWQASWLKREKFDSEFSKNMVSEFNVKYVLEDREVLLNENDINKVFFTTLNNNRYKLYSNQDYSIWYIQ